MNGNVKLALREFIEARKQVNTLRRSGELDQDKSFLRYTREELDALAEAYRNEREANIRFHTMLFQEMGWAKEEVDSWLKKAGLL